MAGFDEISIGIMSAVTSLMHPGQGHYSKNLEKK